MKNLKNEINVNNLFELYEAIIIDCINHDFIFTAQQIEAYAEAFYIELDQNEIELMLKAHKDWEECKNQCSDEYYYLVKARLIGEE